MPANRTNYIVLYKNQSQIYGCSSKDIALTSPLPSGTAIEDKRVFFITYQPDNEVISVHRLSDEEVRSAELKETKPKKTKE